jgi:hypothetical protein
MAHEVESFEEALFEYKSIKEMFSKIKIQIYSVYKFVQNFPEFDRFFYDIDEAENYIKENKYMFIMNEILNATGERNLGFV